MVIEAGIYFWTLHSVPLIYAAVFMPVSYYFDYYSFTIQFETRVFDVFYFVLSKDCFVLQKPGTSQIITFKSVALKAGL